jgi:hypothetical protein
VLVWDWTWRRFNDITLAERHYENAKQYIDHLAGHTTTHTHVLPANWSTHLLGDWCAAVGVNGTVDTNGKDTPPAARHTSGIANTFYFIRATQAFLRAHTALGKPAKDAAPYTAYVSNALSGMNFVYYQKDRQIYSDPFVEANLGMYGTEALQTSLALALTLGVPGLPHVNATAEVAGVRSSFVGRMFFAARR